jgi:hypothetical protein
MRAAIAASDVGVNSGRADPDVSGPEKLLAWSGLIFGSWASLAALVYVVAGLF